MPRSQSIARCSECGRTEPKWVGQCPDCGQWGTMLEEPLSPAPGRERPAWNAPVKPATPIRDVPLEEHARAVTGIGELDRVLGGGLVPGSVVLVGGEPGAGKSTLLLQAAQALAAHGRTVLYVSAEESPGQVRQRAERLEALDDGVLLASETELSSVLGLLDAHAPDVLVLDSIQTVADPERAGTPGSVAQVRDCAAALVSVAKERNTATLLVGHVTKDGQLAGPRVLEHLVDAVLELSGDRHHALRLLRAAKNRFGPAGEIGCFEMGGAGLAAVPDAGRLFVADRPAEAAGVAVTLALEGQRVLACEVQALVAPSQLSNPRRVATGVDPQRLALLLAVLQRRADVELLEHDVYAASVGGLRLTEPGVDLAVCLAVASSRQDRSVLAGLVAIGEVGLAGELRAVAGSERRLAEAARLGFSGAVVPRAYDGADFGLALMRVAEVREALDVGLQVPRG